MALSIRRAAAIPDPPEGGVEYLGDPWPGAAFQFPREPIGTLGSVSWPSRSNRRFMPCGYSRKVASRSAASRVSSMEGTRAKRT
jgi:hypothetical protein